MKGVRDLLRSTTLRHTGVAVLDQGLNSATGFLVGVWLIRHIPAADYGSFVLASAGLFLALGLQHAVVSFPMGVLAPKRPRAEQADFVGSLAVGQFLLWLPAVLVIALGIALAQASRYMDPATTTLAYLTLAAALAATAREFFRQTFFVFASPWLTLAMDGVYTAALVAGVFSWSVHATQPAAATMVATGVAALLSAASGAAFFRCGLGGHFRFAFAPLRTLVAPAKWGVPGMLLSWVQNQGFFYILGALRGAGAVADVSASRLLLVPIPLLITALESVVRPQAAAAVARGALATYEPRLLRLTLGGFVVALGYTVAVFLAREPLVTHVLHKSIDQLTLLVCLWAVVFLCQIWRTNLWVMLQAQERFRALFHLAFVRGLVSLATGAVAVVFFDGAGIVVGLAVGEFVYVWLGRRDERGGRRSVHH